MKNKEFDDIIKEKLESLNTNGSEDAWDLFKQKWDNESSFTSSNEESPSDQDQALDDKIKKDMQGLRMPFNSKHWIILKEQLELEALFKKKLFLAKSVELIILAFLVLGILNLWPIQNDIYHLPVYDIPMVSSVPVDKETAEKHKAQEEVRLANQKALSHQIYNSTKTLVQKTILPVFALGSSSTLKEIKPTSTNLNNASKIDKGDSNKSLPLTFPFINSLQQKSKVNEALESNVSSDNNKPIAALSKGDLEKLKLPIRPIGFPDIVLDNKSKKEENTFLSFAVGPKVNLVNSPFDPVYGFDPYNTINTNFNISAKIQKEIGPIEMYAGLGYTNTSYIPRLVGEIYEPLDRQFNLATLEKIKFKTFNIPVGIKYNLIETDKYQVYTSAGIDMNVIADSEYIIQDQPIGRSQPNKPPSPKNSVNSNAKLSQKEFNNGILAGGSLRDNLYATASVSFGINCSISKRSGVFLEPRYSHFISSNGIGPNSDKVHGLSIDLGVRYQLN